MLAYDFSIIAIKNLPTILFLGLLSTYRLLVDVFVLGYIHRGGYLSLRCEVLLQDFMLYFALGNYANDLQVDILVAWSKKTRKKNVPIHPLSKLLPLQHSLNQKQYCIVEPM